MTISTCAMTASPRQPDGPGGWTLYVSHYDGHVKRWAYSCMVFTTSASGRSPFGPRGTLANRHALPPLVGGRIPSAARSGPQRCSGDAGHRLVIGIPVAGASCGCGHRCHHVIDVLAAASPAGLAALWALDGVAHELSSVGGSGCGVGYVRAAALWAAMSARTCAMSRDLTWVIRSSSVAGGNAPGWL